MNENTDDHAINSLMSLRRIIGANDYQRSILPDRTIESRFRVDRAFYLLKQKLPEDFINESIYDISGHLRFEILGIQTSFGNNDEMYYYQNTFVMKGYCFPLFPMNLVNESTDCTCDDCCIH